MSFLIAFWGGVLSFFSPCILPLIPVYLSYVTSISMYDRDTSTARFTV
ncbi:MAG TPA: cytochrome c biogenesis protein CcdA, partial [bacterium]|nr:cytochrome c biogenesis protein CcdA [bacterium]